MACESNMKTYQLEWNVSVTKLQAVEHFSQ